MQPRSTLAKRAESFAGAEAGNPERAIPHSRIKSY